MEIRRIIKMTRTNDKILLATRNRGKVKEIEALLKTSGLEFCCIYDIPELPEVEEDGASFEENAIKKASELCRASGLTTIADDSGLCVDALGGRPGVHSARYAGPQSSDREKCMHLLEEMETAADPSRSARFVCVVAFVTPQGEKKIFQGQCEGWITRELRGESGFGYDPIFFHDPTGCTFAEMDGNEKNQLSHRGIAIRELAQYLKNWNQHA
jgi:XTP/dITP diphosphohydrolase